MLNGEKMIDKPLRWGMVGGGRTSKVGYKHRSGALRDNTAYKLVAGAFDLDPERGEDFGTNIGVEADRCYKDYQTMFAEEAKREDGIEVVSIATPNNTHYGIAKSALNADLHVICEKPFVFTTEEGEELKQLAKKKGKILGVTYGYSGHPMVYQAKKMIENGDLGEIRIVDLMYAHGFDNEEAGHGGGGWRVNPDVVGKSYVLGDLSTHTFYAAQLMLPDDMKLEELLCDKQSFIKSREPLEDNANVLMHYNNGAVGRMWASSVNAGCMDPQRIRIVGSKASIEWWDSKPNELRYEVQGEANRIMHHGMDYLYDESLDVDRLAALHAEGLAESWANVYLKIAQAIDAKNKNNEEALNDITYPDIDAGIDGVRWIESCVRSAENGGVWVDFE
jgi:predicted dehydrogenase